MDNITKSVVSVLSIAGALAFLTPTNPEGWSGKEKAAKPAPAPKDLAESDFDDEDLEVVDEDDVVVDENGQVDDDDEDDSDWDDGDFEDFGKPSVALPGGDDSSGDQDSGGGRTNPDLPPIPLPEPNSEPSPI